MRYLLKKSLILIVGVLLNLIVSNAYATQDKWVMTQTDSDVICTKPNFIPNYDTRQEFNTQTECENEIEQRKSNNKLWYKSGNDCAADIFSGNRYGKYASKAACVSGEFGGKKWKIVQKYFGVKECEPVNPNSSGTLYNTKEECENALNQGKFELIFGSRATFLPNSWYCRSNTNGTLTYSECQAEAARRNAVGASPPPSTGNNPCGAGTECPTALGNIPTSPTAFTGRVLTIGLGIAGGIALIFMVWGSIKVLTSAGDPKKVSEGREVIVAAIAGLLFLILSVLILRFIGGTFLPTNPFG